MNRMSQGFDHEIEFWKNFVQSERFLTNWVKSERNPEILPQVRELFESEAKGKDTLHVLDIGSGVVSWVKNITPNAAVTPCDPLADEYAKIFDYAAHGQIKPVQGFAEQLPFVNNTFDVVHISNALDHTQDPRKAINEMQRVCRKQGLIIIQGFVNEGEHENYQGLHQWNIEIHDSGKKSLLIRNKDQIITTIKNKFTLFAETLFFQEIKREWFVFAYRNV